MLINARANINAQNKSGYTPLMYAIGNHKNSIENVRILLDHNADIKIQNKYSSTALEQAMESKSTKAIAEMIQEKMKTQHKELMN